MSKKVNLFIVGAPKSGTTAISSYLKKHPDIYFPSIKETHFFAHDFPEFRLVKNLADYSTLYSDAGEEKYLGDGSVWYLYSNIAIQKIWEFNKKSKILILLRNPTEMLPSLHEQLLYTLDEDKESFENSWKLQKERAEGKEIPKTNREAKMLQYLSVVNYYEQLDRVFNYFNKEQVKVILFDDFVRNPRHIYLEILHFLSLEDNGLKEFPKINQRKKTRSLFISKIVNRPPKPLVLFVRLFKKIFNIKDLKILNKLDHSNRIPFPENNIPQSLKKEIVSKTLPSIKKLEELISRDLSSWYKELS